MRNKKNTIKISFLLISEIGVFNNISNLKNMKIKIKTKKNKPTVQNNVEQRPSFDKKTEIFEFNPEKKPENFPEWEYVDSQKNENFIGWLTSKEKQKPEKTISKNPKIKIKTAKKEKIYTTKELK